jgi:hypothetical protein
MTCSSGCAGPWVAEDPGPTTEHPADPDRSIDPDTLAAVERAVADALVTGDDAGLRVLGYGEISLVVGWPADAPVWACKRLPAFPDAAAVARYRTLFDRYLEVLDARGVSTVPSGLRTVDADVPAPVAYVVQPVLPADTLGTAVLRAADPDPDHPLLGAVLDAVPRVVDDRTGIDGQLSNWAWSDGRLTYLDVTTPLLFDADGAMALDAGLFLAAYPWPLRAPIGRFVAPGVIAAYRDPRHVLLDFTANLVKERLDRWIPAVVTAVNGRVDPPVTDDEVHRYYRRDAGLWAAMLRLRRIDRWWQRRVRRRPYPFLLPGPIDR